MLSRIQAMLNNTVSATGITPNEIAYEFTLNTLINLINTAFVINFQARIFVKDVITYA